MMACFRGNREEFYGEVLLLDNRKLTLTAEQGIKRSSKAASILRLVFAELGVVETEFFGLKFCDDRQQTVWLDPSKTLSQHRELAGPPYIFYFGVKFYVDDPSKLKEESSRCQFYLQLRQDVLRGRLPCPAHLRAQLSALMLQVDRGDHSEDDTSDSEQTQEVQLIRKTLRGLARPQAQRHFLSLCSSLQMYGISLFAAYGENCAEYFLGATPVGVVIFKNKELVGKYLWQRINKLHFKDEMFELCVSGKNGSETSFFFQTSNRCDCKRLWKCCIEHHAFFRMSETNPVTHKLKHSSVSCSNTLARPQLNVAMPTKSTVNKMPSADVCVRPMQRAPPPVPANQVESFSSEPMIRYRVPLAVPRRSEGRVEPDHAKSSAPWENNANIGLFNPKFPPNTSEEEQATGSPQRRSRSLDGDRPIRERRRRRSRSRGNTSSGSESEKTPSNGEHRRRRTPNRRDQGPDRTSCPRRRRARSYSPDAQIWKHIQKQRLEPDGLIDRQTEEISYKEVKVSGERIRIRQPPGGRRRHQRWASASDLRCSTELLPPLSVTMAANASCQLPVSP